VFFSCSTTHTIEIKQSKAIYEALGLKKDRKDNFALYKEAASWLRVPYMDGGTSRAGTDCSYLVCALYKTVYNKSIERNSADILYKNCRKISKNKLREGDLVFFNTSGKLKVYVNHVGIYLKEHKFLHSSTSRGVIVSDLEDKYYQKAWVCGGRVK
jgi:cell wall-associated NlpC family hydrolase